MGNSEAKAMLNSLSKAEAEAILRELHEAKGEREENDTREFRSRGKRIRDENRMRFISERRRIHSSLAPAPAKLPLRFCSVLMTGAATFVGFRTIRALIEAGYLVLVVVETKEEHDLLRRYTPWTYQKRIRIGQPTNILEESDMGIDPVCIERATYIIHMAAPLLQEKGIGPEDDNRRVVQGVIDLGMNMMFIASGNSNIKRVIVTSSAAPFISGKGTQDGKCCNDLESLEYDIDGDFPSKESVYGAGLNLMMKKLDAFVKEKKPSFDVVHVLPTTVLGQNPLASTTQELCTGSNAVLLDYLLGRMQPGEGLPAATVHIDDVAAANVNFLNCSSFPPGRYRLVGATPVDWPDAGRIVKKEFPWVADLVFPPLAPASSEFAAPGLDPEWQAESIRYITFEEQVKDTVRCYLGLLLMTRSPTRYDRPRPRHPLWAENQETSELII